jgi:ParB/RepB/Spo0J family partition protein
MSTYQEILLEKITPSPLNPRKNFDPEKMKDLAASIKAKGVVQPILVRTVKDKYELVCGERRFRAAGMVELKTIPAIIREMDDQSVLEVQIIENLQRADIHPMEEAEGYFALSRRPGCDVAKIAEKTGRSVKYVYDRIKLLSLTKEAKELFLANKFTAGHAILLARLSPARQEAALDPQSIAVFTYEHVTDDLYRTQEEKKSDEIVKPRSVRELQIWIDEHVRFERDKVDPMLFPETVTALKTAEEEAEKIVPITDDHYVQTSARADEKTIGPRSWKRADGKAGSKTCEHSVTGVFVVGPGRGEALKVCIAKEKCNIHWSDFQKERKARQASGSTQDEKQKAKEEPAEKKREEERKAKEELRDRWKKALPAIHKALSEAIEKMPVSANGLLADVIIQEVCNWRTPKKENLLPRGKSSDDLIRYLANIIFVERTHGYDAPELLPVQCKKFGLDIWKIIDDVVPPTKKDPESKADKLTMNQKVAKRAAEINREKTAKKQKQAGKK